MALVEVTLALFIPLLPIGLFSTLEPVETLASSLQSKVAQMAAPVKIPASRLPGEGQPASTMNSPAMDALVFLPSLPTPERIAQSFFAPAPQAPPRPVVPAERAFIPQPQPSIPATNLAEEREAEAVESLAGLNTTVFMEDDEEEPSLTEAFFQADEVEVIAEMEAELAIVDEVEVAVETEAELAIADEVETSVEEVRWQEEAGISVTEAPQEEAEPSVTELFLPYESKLSDPLLAKLEMPTPSVVDTPPPRVVIHPVSADARFAILGYVKDADEREYLLLKDSREFGPRKVRVDEARNDPQLLIQHGEDTWIFKIDTVWYSIKRRK
jgi:hypothetical protein